MNKPKTRGQTALEYLLIVVVAIIVVVSVMMWMQRATTTAGVRANESKSELICESFTCDSPGDCSAYCESGANCVNGFCSAPE